MQVLLAWALLTLGALGLSVAGLGCWRHSLLPFIAFGKLTLTTIRRCILQLSLRLIHVMTVTTALLSLLLSLRERRARQAQCDLQRVRLGGRGLPWAEFWESAEASERAEVFTNTVKQAVNFRNKRLLFILQCMRYL